MRGFVRFWQIETQVQTPVRPSSVDDDPQIPLYHAAPSQCHRSAACPPFVPKNGADLPPQKAATHNGKIIIMHKKHKTQNTKQRLPYQVVYHIPPPPFHRHHYHHQYHNHHREITKSRRTQQYKHTNQRCRHTHIHNPPNSSTLQNINTQINAVVIPTSTILQITPHYNQ